MEEGACAAGAFEWNDVRDGCSDASGLGVRGHTTGVLRYKSKVSRLLAMMAV